MAQLSTCGIEQPECTAISLQPDLLQRGIAAGVASAFSSMVMNPLDIVKTRMQAQAAASRPAATPAQFQLSPLATLRYSPAFGAPAIPLYDPLILRRPKAPAYSSVLDGARQIVRYEGLRTLWRGTDAAVLMSVPLVAIYLPLYDFLLPHTATAGNILGPALAGAVSRGAAGLATAPLELARTRMQAAQRGGAAQQSTRFWQHLVPPPGATQLQRFTFLWTGTGASLAKDIPFAALYWTMLEPLRGTMLQLLSGDLTASGAMTPELGEAPPPRTPAELLGVNIASAGIAGSLAAIVTTPFDVAKTKLQTSTGPNAGLVQTLMDIYRAGGPAALMTGAGARIGRTAGGYAIVISLYEMFKSMKAERSA